MTQRWLLIVISMAACERAGDDSHHETATGLARHVTCFLDHGKVACAGSNEWGLLGDGGAGGDSSKPVPIHGPVGIEHIGVSMTETFACAIGHGKVWCWGDGSSLAQSTGQPGRKIVLPHVIESLPPVTRLSVGRLHACALDSEGRAYCWGDNLMASIRDTLGRPARETTPTEIPDLRFKDIVAGNFQSCGLSAGGDLYCWGSAAPGDRPVPLFAPTVVLHGVDAVYVAHAGEMCVRSRDDGKEHCWIPRKAVVELMHENRRTNHGAYRDPPDP